MSGVGTLTGIALESIPEITADKDYGLGENRCKEEKGRGEYTNEKVPSYSNYRIETLV